MTDQELLEKLKGNLRGERRGHAEFLRYLCEVDVRQLHLKEGFSSLFCFCTKVLGLSEPSTSKRIQVARLSKKYPLVLEFIGQGTLSMTNASLLAPHLTGENHRELLEQACGKSKYEVEKLIATRSPQPDFEDSIRRLPVQTPVTFASERKLPEQPKMPSPQVIKPLSASRNKFSFCGDDELVGMYRTLQDRMRHKFPKGQMEDIVREAFRVLLEKTDPGREPQRKISSRSPLKHTRYIPKEVRREVWQRDGGRCGYKSPSGRLCGSKAFLEFDHGIPWSLGGSSQDFRNIGLRCRAHNQLKGGASRPGLGAMRGGDKLPGRNETHTPEYHQKRCPIHRGTEGNEGDGSPTASGSEPRRRSRYYEARSVPLISRTKR